MSETLTHRQLEIVSLVARGHSVNQIARMTRLSPKTVDRHIQDAAERLPGYGKPMHRLTLWFLSLSEDTDSP